MTYEVPLNGDVILRVTGYKDEIAIYSEVHEETISIVGLTEEVPSGTEFIITLPVASWSGNAQSASVPGVHETTTVLVIPSPVSQRVCSKRCTWTISGKRCYKLRM